MRKHKNRSGQRDRERDVIEFKITLFTAWEVLCATEHEDVDCLTCHQLNTRWEPEEQEKANFKRRNRFYVSKTMNNFNMFYMLNETLSIKH